MHIKEKFFERLLPAVLAAFFILLSTPIHGKYAALSPHGPPDATSSRYKFDFELAKGKFLVAGTNIKDPRFAETVIFLVDYGPQGAMGLIVNRLTDIRLSKMFPDISGLQKVADVIYIGGPVEITRLFMLIRTSGKPEDAHPIFDNIYISTSSALLERAANAPDAGERFRIYSGYAGWAPGQLEREIARGDWHIMRGDAEIIFNNAPLEIWETIMNMNMKMNLQV
ncbi:MAG: YqgE/AlgH family protein [Nitrospirae bacterium]|nr:YqgE/AlgH family protein [Nitrospirota bacterium]